MNGNHLAMQRKTHTIDAEDKVLGRLASKVAILLRGKQKPDFVPYKDMGDIVIVKNVEKLKITGRKMEQKKYYRYSGYPGGLKEIPLKRLFKTKPEEVLKKAVYGMLPKNKLRSKQIKRLRFEKSK
ncbi:MAG: 50S ribosomal protein L13 [Candidatus Nealsonbacteria bacterium]|nr:MAG: 50S ribosomal protein L13 [Candidatus Nealsonbacteria bacterium]